MAERRMFAKTIIDSDAFLDMPQSSQLLYFHLSMRADDDGFINNPKSITRNVKCNDDDLTLLTAKKFIIPFQSGIVVIKHWRIHNYIRVDRYKETKYKKELKTLFLDENNSYTTSENMKQIVGIPDDNQMETQDRLDKVSLGKDSLENILSSAENLEAQLKEDEFDFDGFIAYCIDYLNKKTGHSFTADNKKTIKNIKDRLKEGYSPADFQTVIDKKCKQWLKDPVMNKYLKPPTLFCKEHFADYLEE